MAWHGKKRAIRVALACVALAAAVGPACGVGWTDDDLWAAEMKLDELRDAVNDQVVLRSPPVRL
jgi:hypothetical protein